MQEAVSGILIGRSREADGLSRMITLSLGAHVVALAAIAFMPAGWLSSEPAPQERVTTISLGGVPGQEVAGFNAIASRAVQAESAPNERPVVTPPATKPPEMAAPAPEVKPKPAPKPVKPADKATARKPSTGPEVKTGSARVDTPNAVPFGTGLASGGSGTGGVKIEGDFCCPEYIETMKRLIYQTWQQNVGVAGAVDVRFVIRRDGMLTAVAVEKSSGNPILDLESRRAVIETRQLPPLPAEHKHPTLPVILTFEYRR
jgi:TonB family protein